jgi:hypothetical protein
MADQGHQKRVAEFLAELKRAMSAADPKTAMLQKINQRRCITSTRPPNALSNIRGR